MFDRVTFQSAFLLLPPFDLTFVTVPVFRGQCFPEHDRMSHDQMQTPNHSTRDMCEKEALDRIKRGDVVGMGRLYELHKSRVYSLCLRYTNNTFDAEDLTQEVFIQVFRKIDTFRGEAQLGSWIYKVGLNSARLHARRQRRLSRFVVHNIPDETLMSAKSLSRNPAQAIALIEALSSLTPVRRKTLLLHDIQGLTHNEVAARMGGTEIASKSRLHQAHISIRHILGNGTRPLHHGNSKARI
jgi:RNA polymerase sigma-70 factor (ECF subfamily)